MAASKHGLDGDVGLYCSLRRRTSLFSPVVRPPRIWLPNSSAAPQVVDPSPRTPDARESSMSSCHVAASCFLAVAFPILSNIYYFRTCTCIHLCTLHLPSTHSLNNLLGLGRHTVSAYHQRHSLAMPPLSSAPPTRPKRSRTNSSALGRSSRNVQKQSVVINCYDLLKVRLPMPQHNISPPTTSLHTPQPGRLSSLLWTLGTSLLHTGVVIRDREYAYGGHPRANLTGVYHTPPRTEPPGGHLPHLHPAGLHVPNRRRDRRHNTGSQPAISRHGVQSAELQLQPLHLCAGGEDYRQGCAGMVEPGGEYWGCHALCGSEGVGAATGI